MMQPIVDWIIHCCRNGVECAECGDVETGFLDNACNAHTHGMEKYGHLDFQLVLALPDREIGRILNTFGLMVQQGRKFSPGDTVSGIYEDCDVRLELFKECNRDILRVVIPDKHNIFPDNQECEYPYTLQKYDTDMLHSEGGAKI